MTSCKTLGFMLITAAVVAMVGCNLDPYKTGADPKRLDAGPFSNDGRINGDAVPDACVPSPEICDNLDNDCDTIIDNGFDKNTDLMNCGTCGNECRFDFALASCVGGECVMGDCLPGHHNNDNEESNGCEFQCVKTNGGVELCDGVDNDCDGAIDEDFDIATDPNNCGTCNNVCRFLNGNGSCSGGNCVLSSCLNGFKNLDGLVGNGCECKMDLDEAAATQTCDEAVGGCPAGQFCADPNRDGTAFCFEEPLDLCDGRDNDCDGQIDEDAFLLLPTRNCYPYPSGCVQQPDLSFNCEGPCQSGTLQCTADGRLQCEGHQGPTVETCDDVDNDCNGVVDDQWDKLNDPNNCDGCGNICSFVNAVAGCREATQIPPQKAECYIVACLPGFWNLDGDDDATDIMGCEYECTMSNNGVEKCGDGEDNNCDGQIDEGFFLQTDENNCGACGFSCSVNKPTGAVPRSTNPCEAGVCKYECDGDNHDIDGDLGKGVTSGGTDNTNGCEYYCINQGAEECNGVDDNCNKEVDEGFDLDDPTTCGNCTNDCTGKIPPNAELDLSAGPVGGCESGQCVYRCLAGFVDQDRDLNLPSSPLGCECEIKPEICDGLDNNCNGLVDEVADATGCVNYYRDRDRDHFGDQTDTACLCDPKPLQLLDATDHGTGTFDCNDQNPNVYPRTAPEDNTECDGLDNDCDGYADNPVKNDGAKLTRYCYTGPGGSDGVGICHGGSEMCDSSEQAWSGICSGEQLPEVEVCDASDNNCDGVNNEGLTVSDPDNCGACGTRCDVVLDPTHGQTTCVASNCVYVNCIHPWYDLDATDGDCEYLCPTTAVGDLGAPDCNNPTGDKNCNGILDGDGGDFNFAIDAYNCGECNKICGAEVPYGMRLDLTTASGTGCEGGVCQYVCAAGFVDTVPSTPGCECSITGPEVCDGVDNDCVGGIDDGIFKDHDVNNCGNCNFACADLAPDASALADYHVEPDLSTPWGTGCEDGVCQFACLGWFLDLNKDIELGRKFGPDPGQSDGCEYECDTDPDATTLEDDPSLCDGYDNDCDGFTDRYPRGHAKEGELLSQECYEGTGSCTWDGSQWNCVGCAYAGGQWRCEGECATGSEICDGAGAYGDCLGQRVPQPMDCTSTKDNDCNGLADNTEPLYDTDAFNCGTCGNNCYENIPFPDNMIPDTINGACVGGECQYTCAAGHRDLNNDMVSDGCEQACEVYPYWENGEEDCNGLDDDCDGQVDEPEGLALAVNPLRPNSNTYCSYKGHPSLSTPCDGVQMVCNAPGTSSAAWHCDWDSRVVTVNATDLQNVVASVETRCDGEDNNCDGYIDEAWPDIGDTCYDSGQGICRREGAMACALPLPSATTECSFVGYPAAGTPTAELCNGLDDDCDGLVDESRDNPGDVAAAPPGFVQEDVVQVNGTWAYVYEASRPDATSLYSGSASHRSCSREGRLPWSNVTKVEAEAACAAAGMRLCEELEWEGICEGEDGGGGRMYPYLNHLMTSVAYNSGYEDDVCNGRDYDGLDCTGLDDDQVIATGGVESNCRQDPWDPAAFTSDCISAEGVYDLSGNLMEWTSTLAQDATNIYKVRGGSYLTAASGLTCQEDFVSLRENFRYDDLGFRCCSDVDPNAP